ncbi:MAG: hypothetical protein AAF074_03500, partial [Pseudomonadota bacterium]
MMNISENDAETLGNALAKMLSPVSEPLAALGDVFRYARFVGMPEIQAGLARAAEIRRNENLPRELPNKKEFLNWIEGVSSENLSDETMMEMWSRVVAEMGSEFDVDKISIMNVLRSIGGAEARLLADLCQNFRFSQFPDVDLFTRTTIDHRFSHSLTRVLSEIDEADDYSAFSASVLNLKHRL